MNESESARQAEQRRVYRCETVLTEFGNLKHLSIISRIEENVTLNSSFSSVAGICSTRKKNVYEIFRDRNKCEVREFC